jgi:DNA repair protein RadA/Sms
MPQCMADVAPQAVEWLWASRIPLGSVTLLQGYPGCGKSSLTIDLAARVSQGRAMPMDTRPGSGVGRPVLFVAPEDAAESVLRGRLESADADLSNVFFLTSEEVDQLRADPRLLSHLIPEYKSTLVVVDPITDIIGAGSERQVRKACNEWGVAAQQCRTAIVLVRHFQKELRGHLSTHGLGSIGLSAMARATLSVETISERGREAIVSVTKNNYGLAGEHLRFQLGETIEWIGSSPVGVGDLLGNSSRPRVEAAKDTLLLLLGEGPVRVKDLKKACQAHGDSWASVRRAKLELGVVVIRQGFGKGSYSTWALPETQEIRERVEEMRSRQMDQLMENLRSTPAQPPRSRRHRART